MTPMRDMSPNADAEEIGTPHTARELVTALRQFAITVNQGLPPLGASGGLYVEPHGLVARLARELPGGVRQTVTQVVSWDDLLSARSGAAHVFRIELEHGLHALGLR